MISFLPLTPPDFPLLLVWLSKPHIREWWDDGDDTLEKVAQHYGKEIGVSRFLIHWRITPDAPSTAIGYIQCYEADENCMGIDLLMGEERFLNRGLGTQVLQAFIAQMMEQHAPAYFIIDPDLNNARAIRCYQKVGFRHTETLLTEEGKYAYMMRLDRRNLYHNS